MIWLTGIIGFAIGLCTGAVLFKQFKSDAVKVRQLEDRLQALQEEHGEYKQQVQSHFTTTAALFHNLTDSYRDVYNHLATGASKLCPDDVSNQLSLKADNREILTEGSTVQPASAERPPETTIPPRDYGSRKGNLSEDYGLYKDKEAPSQ